MSEENKLKFIKRLKSLMWSMGTMALPLLVDFGASSIELFNLPTWLCVFLGLLFAQITKALNSK